MSLERLRRQHGLDYKPHMVLNQVKHDKQGKRYIFRLNDDAIFYAIGADDFWKGAHGEPAPPADVIKTIPAAPEPATAAAARTPGHALVRAENLQPGDVFARKNAPDTHLTLDEISQAKTPDKIRLSYQGKRGARAYDCFRGEKFILHRRKDI